MEKLLFVYNANSGRLNSLLDTLHKTLKPATYSCKLCRLTHGPVSERKSWRKFKEQLDIETEFYHKDEFEKSFASKFGYRFEYPIILMQTSQGLEVFIDKRELDGMETSGKLETEIEMRLKTGS